MEDNWGAQGRPILRNIYDVEALQPKPRDGRGARRGEGRYHNRGDPAREMYNLITADQGIHTEGGGTSRDAYYQTMGELNYPADEQFRKESQIMKNRLERDRNMKMKRKVKIIDVSTDEFVIPCTFPSAMNLEEKADEKPALPPSSLKIENFLTISRQLNRWADGVDEDDEEAGPRRNEAIEKLMVTRSVEAASALEAASAREAVSALEQGAVCLSFEDYPPVFKKRSALLRTIVIDGCAVMKQVNFKFEVPWNPSGGTTNTFRGNKLLVMKPLIELTMRFLLQGHKTVIILPSYYMIPVFAGVRQKVDDVAAFNALVGTGIVQFIEEDVIEEMHRKLHEENAKMEGTFVSTSDLERIIKAVKKVQDKKREDAGEILSAEEEERRRKVPPCAEFSHRLTPFFYDNKLILPLHMSTSAKKIILADKLLYHEEETEERRRSQLTMKEQKKILLALQDLFDLPLRLLRAMMMFRRVLKEMEDNEEEKRKIEGEMAIKDLVDATRQAFQD